MGIGLVLQNHFNGDEENNESLIELMKNYNMPYRIEDIGIEKTDEVFNKYYDLIANSDAVDPEDKQKFGRSWRYFWDLL